MGRDIGTPVKAVVSVIVVFPGTLPHMVCIAVIEMSPGISLIWIWAAIAGIVIGMPIS